MREGWRSLRRARASICLTRSRVTPMITPISSRVSILPGQLTDTQTQALRKHSSWLPLKLGMGMSSTFFMWGLTLEYSAVSPRKQKREGINGLRPSLPNLPRQEDARPQGRDRLVSQGLVPICWGTYRPRDERRAGLTRSGGPPWQRERRREWSA
jgi:hypothetical protein